MFRRRLALALCLGALGAPRLAAAGPADTCIAASEQAQRLRAAGKLTSARDELVTCSKPECPKLVQTDCTQWMGEVLAILPSVVAAAKDPNGKDVVEGRFFIDGRLTTETLDGRPVPVDTGVHVFRVEAPGLRPAEERVVVRAGEQNRVVTFELEAVVTATPTKSAPVPVVPIALAAGGLALATVGVVMNLGATSDAHDLRRTCAPTCAESDVDDIRGRYVFAGLLGGAGLAAIATGAVLYFIRKDSSPGQGRGVEMAVSPLVAGGAMAQGRISF